MEKMAEKRKEPEEVMTIKGIQRVIPWSNKWNQGLQRWMAMKGKWICAFVYGTHDIRKTHSGKQAILLKGDYLSEGKITFFSVWNV